MTATTMLSTETRTLVELEGIIERGLQTFVEVGQALREIREQRLYRETHATFEAYCKERWGWSRVHAHRHIEAAKVASLLPMGNRPVSERVARELTAVEPEQVPDVWAETVQQHGPEPTAKQTRAVVRRSRRTLSVPWDYTEINSRINMAISRIMMDVPKCVDREPIAIHLESLARYYRKLGL